MIPSQPQTPIGEVGDQPTRPTELPPALDVAEGMELASEPGQFTLPPMELVEQSLLLECPPPLR